MTKASSLIPSSAERLDRRDRRLADPDGADLLGSDERDRDIVVPSTRDTAAAAIHPRYRPDDRDAAQGPIVHAAVRPVGREIAGEAPASRIRGGGIDRPISPEMQRGPVQDEPVGLGRNLVSPREQRIVDRARIAGREAGRSSRGRAA